jgi:hypothetical protein
MSTSTSKDVVADYANSEQPLVFCVTTEHFMTCGADVSWLSVYPTEAEILYPPLTYLKYAGERPIKNSTGMVVYVEPTMS